jgi:hypothetical protein
MKLVAMAPMEHISGKYFFVDRAAYHAYRPAAMHDLKMGPDRGKL